MQFSASQPGSVETARSFWNTTRSFLVHFSLWSHNKWWPAKSGKAYKYHPALSAKISINKAQWKPAKNDKAYQYHPSIIHCPLGYIYILSKHHVFSQASTLAKTSHALFPGCLQKNLSVFSKTSSHVSASAKTSSHKTVSRKHHMTQLCT